MGGQKAQPIKTPFQQEQATTNTYGIGPSIAATPEGKAFAETPLDLGSPVSVDPGVGHRTALKVQGINNRYGGGFMSGIPAWIRDINRNKEVSDAESEGAYEGQQAEYANQQANNALRAQQTMTELERRRQLLPTVVQTGGSGSSSGFNTQLTQPQPGFLSTFAGGLGAGIGSALQFPKI